MHQEKRFIVDVLFVLALFGLFAVSALMLVTVGADVYKHTVDDMSANYETRVSVSYIAEKIRQNDGNITIDYLGETPALVMEQEYNDELYSTYLYYHDDCLKELLVRTGSYIGDNNLAAGQEIMKLSTFNADLIWGNLLKIELTTADGDEEELFLHLHTS